jgi:RNA polymerase sigma factor for flagellar operon FliA
MYSHTATADREKIVLQYAPLVKRIAHHLFSRLPANVQLDDLVQNGMMGLLDAAGRFEDGMGAQFETYAAQRIRGAMLDGLRENDWLPRGLRRDMRRIETAIHQLEQQFCRPPLESELAQNLGVPLAEYQHMLQEARGHQLVYLEDFNHEEGEDFLEKNLPGGVTPLEELLDSDLRAQLVDAINSLPEREQMLMALYYDEELNLREIGEVLGVTESRICQLHSQAVARLRAKILGAIENKPKRGRKKSSEKQS